MWHARLRFVTGAQTFWPIFVLCGAGSESIDAARSAVRRIIQFAKTTEPTLSQLVERDFVPFRAYVRILLQQADVRCIADQRLEIVAMDDHLVVKIAETDLFDRKLSPDRREAAIRNLLELAGANEIPEESAEDEIVRALLSRDDSKGRATRITKPCSEGTFEIWVPGVGEDHDLEASARRNVEDAIVELKESSDRRLTSE
jgi:hypothetical protein